MADTVEKTYQPNTIESKWYQHWEDQNHFSSTNHKDASNYCIMIPPPNVTGSLHMGHGFQSTLMDTLVRYHRMMGFNTHWQVGTDHAGIATQMVVERKCLQEEKKTRHDFGRDSFIEKIWQWKASSGNQIEQQLKRMGASCDWSKNRFTMDDSLSKAVQNVFIKLHKEGLIYRGKRLVNWDTVLGTAISDLEVINETRQGHLWHIRYPIVNSKESIIIATTRPETLLGDTAVAVHPDDERYQALIGKSIQLPLTSREIPIIADNYVDREFGTGCVKITPAHDFNDYAMGKRHQLPMINILNKDGTLNENTPKKYQQLDRLNARQHMIDDLTKQGLIEKIEPHTLNVPIGDRSNSIIEPYLTDQWFVKMETLAQPALQAVKDQSIQFIPKNWENTYFQWLENIEDWCISRQLWWGHRIPAWYDEQGNHYVGEDETTIRNHYKLADSAQLTQDEDVLDTWFSSALWPFATLGWPENTEALKQFYPTQVLVTGFDIIFFWVARMIMMGLKLTDQIPFEEIYITGLIRDHEGQKMSKSKGNVLDPIDLIDGISLDDLITKRTAHMMQPQLAQKIEKSTRKEFPEGIAAFGTDAVRFTYCALASTGRDIRFDLSRLEGYRNFCNKIWNATRFVLIQTENTELQFNPDKDKKLLTTADNWINGRLESTIQTCHQHIKNYRFDLLTQALYEFTWYDYCDWYLELSKVALQDNLNSSETKRAIRHNLLNVLEQIMRLIHPVMPFISEEIWQKLIVLLPENKLKTNSIMIASYPRKADYLINTNDLVEINQEMQWLKASITGIRNIRGEMKIKPSLKIPLLLQFANKCEEDNQHKRNITKYQSTLSTLTRIERIDWLEIADTPPPVAVCQIESLKLMIPMQGLIDVNSELTRIVKQSEKLNKEQQRIAGKLSNEKFVSNAPATVVAKEKQILQEVEEKLEQLQSEKIKLEQLQ